MLLVPLCYIQFGYYGQFIVQRWRVQKAAREAWLASLPDSAFVRLSLASINASGKWQEEGKECWYAGHLYDVIRQRTTGDATWLFCLDDDREERLIDESVHVTKANQDLPVKRNAQPHLNRLSTGDLLCKTTTWDISPLPSCESPYYPGEDDRLAARPSDIVIPPPKPAVSFFG